jgi:pimeloyl-ACP methyl ester carboxylesterase
VARPFLTTCDSVQLAGRRWLTGQPPRAAVVLAHGFTASSDDPRLVALAETLHDRQLDVVTYDARGHGGSGGVCTLGDLERHDVAAAVELARTRTAAVVLVGASMGAIAVLRHAAEDPQVVGTVIVSSPARWAFPRTVRSVLAAALTRTPPGRAIAARYLRVAVSPRWTSPDPPVDLIARIAAPVAVIHGAADKFIPAHAGRELYDAAPEPRRHELVRGMGHGFERDALGPIVDAVEWSLQAAPVPSPGA